MFLFRRVVPVAPAAAAEAESVDECMKTNMLVVGCGPAGLGLLVRAARDEKIDDLVSRTPSIIAAETEELEDTATAKSQTRKKKLTKKCRGKDKEYGLLVVDKASENKVGGGKLLDYLIRSNTASARFVGTVTGAKVSSLQNYSASPNRTNSSDITRQKIVILFQRVLVIRWIKKGALGSMRHQKIPANLHQATRVKTNDRLNKA